jgi:hypothetical protein
MYKTAMLPEKIKKLYQMKTVEVKKSFNGYSDARLNTEGKNIIERMTANPNFVDPVPAIPEVLASWTAFSRSLPQAQTGDRTQIAIKNALKDDLTAKLQKLGSYVNFVSDGDLAKLNSSGFPLSGGGVPVVLQKPLIAVTNGNNPGEMIITITNATGARAYVYEYTADPVTDESIWTSKGYNTRQFTFSNLEAGKKYWFRVTAIGTNGQEMISDIVVGIAL